MKIFLSFLFLGMAVSCHAQKIKRHELAVGWYGGCFFDNKETPCKFQAFGHFPTITYNYVLSKKTSIGALYGMQQFGYYEKGYDWLNNKNRTLIRSIRRFSINVGYDVSTKPVVLRVRSGVMYNNGVKLKHLYSYDHGPWLEVYQDGIKYNDLGVTFGLSIQHQIVWRFFGEVSGDYLQMFSGVDKQQLLLSYRIGFKF